MPDKNPAADRHHGGPGSSHENARKRTPEERRDSGGHSNHPPLPGEPTNPDRSQLSGGGGERDKHHTHDPRTKS
ncbi:MAG TPA: hypothetical protein VE650_10040 [Acetobacteraceae bacterium]|nr:hypothetical protein [Acetobacteraceae bacterium]